MTTKSQVRHAFPTGIFLGVVALTVVAILVLTMIQARKPARGNWACRNNLRQIGLALNTYHTLFGSLPPAVMFDSQGRPAHSWRMIASRCFETLDRPYNLLEPWNSPANLEAAASAEFLPRFMRCTIEEAPQPNVTDCVAVTGPGFVFNEDKGVRTDEITDGLDKTILVVEVARSGIHWNEPRDLTWDEFAARVDERRVGNHDTGFNVLFSDGRAAFFQYGIDRPLLRAYFTIDGGEDIEALQKAKNAQGELRRDLQRPATVRQPIDPDQTPGSQTPATEEP